MNSEIDLRERIVRLEANVENLSKHMDELKKDLTKSIDELKDTNKRVEEKLDEHLKNISSLNTKVAFVVFLVSAIVSGFLNLFFRKSGG